MREPGRGRCGERDAGGPGIAADGGRAAPGSRTASSAASARATTVTPHPRASPKTHTTGRCSGGSAESAAGGGATGSRKNDSTAPRPPRASQKRRPAAADAFAVTVPPPMRLPRPPARPASGRSSAAGAGSRGPRRPSTDTRACARDQPGSASRAAARWVASAGHRQRGRFGGVSREHARVADREQLRGRRRHGQHTGRAASSSTPPARARGATAKARLIRRPPATKLPRPPRGLARHAGERYPHLTRTPPAARRSTDSPAPGPRAARSGPPGAGLSPTASARAAARAAPAHSHSVWPVRTSCQATTRGQQHGRHDRHRFDGCLTGFRAGSRHRATVPRGGARDNARGLRKGYS